MDDARKRLSEESEKLASRGLDVEPITNQLTELNDTLKKSRTYVHTFSRASFQQAAAPGLAAITKTDELTNAAHQEFEYRRWGLRAAIAIIGLLMLTIYLKLRQLEKE